MLINRHPNLLRCTAVFRCLVAVLGCGLLAETVHAKRPGGSHCYRRVCVKVMKVAEVNKLLGTTVRMNASHYGDPSVDPFNRGTFTSNGERFDANDPTRIASSNIS